MFNLEQAIEDWRRRLASGGIKSADVLDELENHLREDIESQRAAGASEEQALTLAIDQMGHTELLRQEFDKLRRPKLAGSWRFVRVACAGTALFILVVSVSSLALFEPHPASRAVGMGFAALTATYLASLPYWYSGLSLVRKVSFRKALFLASLLVATWTLACLLGSLGVIQTQLGDSIVLSAIFWPLCAACGLTALTDMCLGSANALGNALISSQALDRLTPAALRTLELARSEAAGLNHDFIGTEHLLLALLNIGEGAANDTVTSLGLDQAQVRKEIQKLIGVGPFPRGVIVRRYTPRLGRALKLAGGEAQRLKRRDVGEAELLLGLLAEGEGVAALALRNLGVNLDTARARLAGQS